MIPNLMSKRRKAWNRFGLLVLVSGDVCISVLASFMFKSAKSCHYRHSIAQALSNPREGRAGSNFRLPSLPAPLRYCAKKQDEAAEKQCQDHLDRPSSGVRYTIEYNDTYERYPKKGACYDKRERLVDIPHAFTHSFM